MAKFIKLTRADDVEIFINFDLVQAFLRAEGETRIFFQDEDYISVKKKPEQILSLIQAA